MKTGNIQFLLNGKHQQFRITKRFKAGINLPGVIIFAKVLNETKSSRENYEQVKRYDCKTNTNTD